MENADTYEFVEGAAASIQQINLTNVLINQTNSGAVGNVISIARSFASSGGVLTFQISGSGLVVADRS